MLLAGVSMKVSSDRLGHSNIGTTMDLYGHPHKSLELEASEKIDSLLQI